MCICQLDEVDGATLCKITATLMVLFSWAHACIYTYLMTNSESNEMQILGWVLFTLFVAANYVPLCVTAFILIIVIGALPLVLATFLISKCKILHNQEAVLPVLNY